LIIVKFHGATGHIFAFRNMNAHEPTGTQRLPPLAESNFGREI
jgi:hypothetical protein